MQKRTLRSLPLAALLAASAHAQSGTITSTIPVCPTAASITITLPTTVTFCPGPHCNGGGSGPQITPAPTNGVGMPGVNVGQYTSVGPDGKTTVLGIWETVYDSMCSTGLVPATYTITQECPCEATPHPTIMPTGFETTVVPCSVCEHPTVTLTQPCPTGPYASQTPSVGKSPAMPVPAAPAPAAPAGASAGAGSGSGASAQAGPGGAMANAGSGAGASAQAAPAAAPGAPGAGMVSPAGASAGAGSGSGAAAQAGPGGAMANAGSGSGASAEAGPGGASAVAGAESGASAQAGPGAAAASPAANGVGAAPMGSSGTPSVTPVSNITTPGMSPIQSYVSSAGQATFAGLTLCAAFVASLLL